MGGGSFFTVEGLEKKVLVDNNLLGNDEQVYDFDDTPQLLNTIKVKPQIKILA